MYSIILLLSFWVGMLQPILPMIEYYLDGGSLVEVLNTDSSESEGICHGVHLNASNHCEAPDADGGKSLLDDDFYPIGVQIAATPKLMAFPHEASLYLPPTRHVEGPEYLPIPPPPRLG
jgi:hypothetical protein